MQTHKPRKPCKTSSPGNHAAPTSYTQTDENPRGEKKKKLAPRSNYPRFLILPPPPIARVNQEPVNNPPFEDELRDEEGLGEGSPHLTPLLPRKDVPTRHIHVGPDRRPRQDGRWWIIYVSAGSRAKPGDVFGPRQRLTDSTNRVRCYHKVTITMLEWAKKLKLKIGSTWGSPRRQISPDASLVENLDAKPELWNNAHSLTHSHHHQ